MGIKHEKTKLDCGCIVHSTYEDYGNGVRVNPQRRTDLCPVHQQFSDKQREINDRYAKLAAEEYQEYEKQNSEKLRLRAESIMAQARLIKQKQEEIKAAQAVIDGLQNK